jgi:hypothetical protein
MGEWMGACVRIVCVHAREIEDGRRGGGGGRTDGQKGGEVSVGLGNILLVFCGTWKYFARFLRKLEILCYVSVELRNILLGFYVELGTILREREGEEGP